MDKEVRKIYYYMYFVVNFSNINFRCGPLVHMWAMRFEGKHQYFKHMAKVIGNFKNIPKTLAKRHAQYMTYQLINPSKYLTDKIKCGRGEFRV